MFFSRKPTGVILVQRNALVFCFGNSAPLSMPFPEGAVQYLEVRDANKLAAAVGEFTKRRSLSGERLLILLDRDVVFQKAVILQKETDPNTAQADFESKIPFGPQDRQALSLSQKERLFLFGVNRSMYHTLATILQHFGAKVQAVVPGIIYGASTIEKLTPEKCDRICDDTRLMHTVDFLTH